MEAVENTTPTETKTPRRAPRNKNKSDSGIYVVHGCGCTIFGFCWLLGFLIGCIGEFRIESLYFLFVALFCFGVAIYSFFK